MLITGLINLFVNYVDRKDGTNFPTFSTTISTKIKDSEDYLNMSLEVRFSSENFQASDLRKLKENFMYNLDIEEAWLQVRSYNDSEENEVRKIYLFVNKATLKGRKEINKSKTKKSTGNDELPF